MWSASLSILLLLCTCRNVSTADILPWENYLELGTVNQPLGLTINQSSLAHRHFLIGYLCLHSFMYDTAQEAFQLAIETDPTLVEAHLGRLLGHKQALWSYTNRSGALEVWNDTWSVFDNYNVLLTPRQLNYLDTVYQWFIYENTTEGEEAFLNSMLNITREVPSDVDAQTLLGLAYLNKALRQTEDFHQIEPPSLLTARSILQEALVHEPSHPGCLHYLIHAFDVAHLETALQSVPYAYKYSQVARTASHAQHMPTHTWTHIGAWSLAQMADAQSIEVSLLLCIIKQEIFNSIELLITQSLPMTFSELHAHLNSSEFQLMLVCDRDNRRHSQMWLTFTYLQTGRYKQSINVLKDLLLSNSVSSPQQFDLYYIYIARTHIVVDVFFWIMYNREKNQNIFIRTMNELLIEMDPNPIEMLTDNTTSDTYLEWSEIVAQFAYCLRLLFVNDTTNSVSIDDHLSRMINISSIIQSKTNSTPVRSLLMIAQINALRWCVNGSIKNCLLELENATRIESSFGNQLNRPSILHIRASELLAFYLLIIHRFHFGFASTYVLNNTNMSVKDFPSYAFRLYAAENQTDPHRAVNLLGMARAYAQMGKTNEANKLYEKILQEWSDSMFSFYVDRLVIEEASDYILATRIDQIKNNVYIRRSSFSILLVLFSTNVVTIGF